MAPTRQPHAAWAALVCMTTYICCVEGVIPTGEIVFQSPHSSTKYVELLCAPSSMAGWGVPLPQLPNSRWKQMHILPSSNARGCEPYAPDDQLSTLPLKTVVIADRGECSFVQKAQLAQSAGASALIVRGTKRAIYEAIQSQRNDSELQARPGAMEPSPKPHFEYDCSHGEAFVDTIATPAWQTDDVQCASNERCASKMCVLTGAVDEQRGGHQVCCMWDTHVLMGANHSEASTLTIPVVYVTVHQGKQLERLLHGQPTLLARLYRRLSPMIDVSSLLLWALGVATAIGGSYYAALPDRTEKCTQESASPDEHHDSVRQPPRSRESRELDTWELDSKLAIGFIVCAGIFLTVLYFVDAHRIVPVLFCFAATITTTQLVMAPLLSWLVPSASTHEIQLPSCCRNENDGNLTLAEVFGLLMSLILVITWYWNRATCWYLQDAFGVILCFAFLRTILLPNLKVAAILLCMAFVYDIFFVFISPYFFGSSVMENVASGGSPAYMRDGYPGVDFCERYPTYAACVEPEPMPMLLVFPRVFDWAGGLNMLGLGDIIIPGLLLTFVLRFDYSSKCVGDTYFMGTCVGYAIGLAMANIAVAVMQMGQPALMYLVPTTLGVLVFRAWYNGDFWAMWEGLDDDSSTSKKYDEEAASAMVTSREQTAVQDNSPLLGR